MRKKLTVYFDSNNPLHISYVNNVKNLCNEHGLPAGIQDVCTVDVIPVGEDDNTSAEEFIKRFREGLARFRQARERYSRSQQAREAYWQRRNPSN